MLASLGRLLVMQGRPDEAEPLLCRANELAAATFGPDHENLATGLDFLASLYKGRGDLAAAEPLYRRAVAIWRARLAAAEASGRARDPVADAVAAHAAHVAGRLAGLGGAAAAAVAGEAALPLDPRLAMGLNNLALLLQQQGRAAEAAPLFEEAATRIGRAHPYAAAIHLNLATLLLEERRYAEAEPPYHRALEGIMKGRAPPDMLGMKDGVMQALRMCRKAAAEGLGVPAPDPAAEAAEAAEAARKEAKAARKEARGEGSGKKKGKGKRRGKNGKKRR